MSTDPLADTNITPERLRELLRLHRDDDAGESARAIARAIRSAADTIEFWRQQAEDWKGIAESLDAKLNTPELDDFAKAVVLEAAHQRERWSAEHDAGKSAADWFWLLGWLAGKAVHAQVGGDQDKAKHHVITTAAACANWHAAITGADTRMRPGIDTPAGETQ